MDGTTEMTHIRTIHRTLHSDVRQK